MRNVFVLAVGLAALVLTGCVEPAPEVTPTASAGEPVFASEEEALAAAEEVFAKYIQASTVMGLSGGADMSGFAGLLTPRLLEEETETAKSLQDRGRRLEGAYAYYGLELQQLDQAAPPAVFLQAYACLDLSDVKFVDGEGTHPAEASHAPIEIVFVNEADDPDRLILERVDRWTGSDFCS